MIVVRRKDVLTSEGRPVPGVLAGMLDEGVRALLGAKVAAEAWRRLVRPTDVVGIKSNARPMRAHYWAGLGTCIRN